MYDRQIFPTFWIAELSPPDANVFALAVHYNNKSPPMPVIDSKSLNKLGVT